MQPATPIAERTLLNVLRRGVELHPDRPALSDDFIELTYQQLWDRACAVAGGLLAAGVGKGDPVLMMLETSADCFVLLVATSFIGAPLVPVNLAYKKAQLAHVIAEAGCVAAVVDRDYLDVAQEASDGRFRVVVVRDPAEPIETT